MKLRIHRSRLKLLLLAVAFLMTITTALAKETVKKKKTRAPLGTREHSGNVRSCNANARPAVVNKNLDLLGELVKPDTSLLAELERTE